jgi:hypothetical protein
MIAEFDHKIVLLAMCLYRLPTALQIVRLDTARVTSYLYRVMQSGKVTELRTKTC